MSQSRFAQKELKKFGWKEGIYIFFIQHKDFICHCFSVYLPMVRPFGTLFPYSFLSAKRMRKRLLGFLRSHDLSMIFQSTTSIGSFNRGCVQYYKYPDIVNIFATIKFL